MSSNFRKRQPTRLFRDVGIAIFCRMADARLLRIKDLYKKMNHNLELSDGEKKEFSAFLVTITSLLNESISEDSYQHMKSIFQKLLKESQKHESNHILETCIFVLKNYCKFFLTMMDQNLLWQCSIPKGGTWPKNAFIDMKFTICAAVVDCFWNICKSMVTEELRYTSTVCALNCSLILELTNLESKDIFCSYSHFSTAMIIFDDCDLEAAFEFLIFAGTSKMSVWCLKAVLVQESIKDIFMDKLYTYSEEEVTILSPLISHFRNSDDVIKKVNSVDKLSAVSIWSENTVNLINYIREIEAFLIWLNSYGDLGPSIILNRPLKPKCKEEIYITDENLSELKDNITFKRKYKLFYDNEWKEPSSYKYWFDDDSKEAWAAANEKDVRACMLTAANSYRKWHTYSQEKQRMAVLEKFSERIRSLGDKELADSMQTWIQSQNVFHLSSTIIKVENVEVTSIREAKGIIVIARKDKHDVLRRLVHACVAGNCVVVLSGPGLYSIAEYCDMFVSCGFPLGVINSLSVYDIPTTLKILSMYEHVSVICTDFKSDEITEKVETSYWVDDVEPLDSYKSVNAVIYYKYTKIKYIWQPLH